MALSKGFLAWEESLEKKIEESKALAIALNMLQRNMSLEVVAEVTGLTIAQLQQLQTEKR